MHFSESGKKKRKSKLQDRYMIHPGSFRDPSGFLFWDKGRLFRGVNFEYKQNYDFLIRSGLFKLLTDGKFLIPHKEIKHLRSGKFYKILKPKLIPFVSYPYEWCFGQLKDAAILTLKINKESIKKGMILKDASAYNIQFLEGKPIFIDTLSFEKYEEGSPWIAYQQFCRHFLAPLLLASYKDYRLIQLSKLFLDGIPLDFVSKLLPSKSYLNFSVLSNIHMHAKAEKSLESKFIRRKNVFISKRSLLAIVDNLENMIAGLRLKMPKSEWQDYYHESGYSPSSLRDKKDIVKSFLKVVGSIDTLWDLGANTGYFSRNVASGKTTIINFDNDFLAIEKNYQDIKKKKITNTLPLVMDLVNPSSGVGWMNKERNSLVQRGPCDVSLALALVHHLAISNNLPFFQIADFFAKISKWLVVEFVPKDDMQIKRMLFNRKDIFSEYSIEIFEEEFSRFFTIVKRVIVKKQERMIYLMKKK